MPTAAELTVQINTKLNDQGLVDADRRVEQTTSRWKTMIGTAGGFLLAQGVQMVAQNIGGLVSAGLDFEAQMANVNSIAQLSASELQNLSDQVLGLTNNPGIRAGPADLAAGLYDISSSGFVGAEGLQVLEQAALAATAGVTSTATAAKGGTAVLNAYGLGADQARSVFDVMFQTVNEGVIWFDQLASNMGNVLPVAASLGIGFEEVGAAYAQMTLAGVGASQAETQIAALMRSALNPTQQLTDAVTAAGHASATAAIESEGLAGFLSILSDAAGGSQEELFTMLGTTEAMNAALLLGGDNMEDYIAAVGRMGEATEGAGATQTALNKQMQSASFQLAKAKQQIQVAATMFMGFLAPGISAAAQAFTGFMSKGVIPFVDVIGTALRGGFEFRDAVAALPEPLRRTAGALGSVFESVGDVVRAFGERGLSGAIKTLTEGGELRQIGTALSAIGQEAWNAAVAGLQAMPWGTLWDTVVSAVPATVDLLIDLVPKIGKWLWDTGGDLISWAIGHLPGTATRGDGTEGPAGTNAASTVDVVLDLAAQLGRWIWGTGSDLASWLQGKVTDLGEPTAQLLQWTLTVAAPNVAGWILDAGGDLWGWLKGKMGLTTGDPNSGSPGQVAAGGDITVSDWVLNVGIPSLEGWASDYANRVWDWLEEEIGPIIGKIGEWTLTVGIPELSGWLWDNKGDLWAAFKTIAAIPSEIQGAVTDWTLTVAAPAIGGWLEDIGGNLWGWLKEKMGIGGTGDPNSGSPGQVANGGDLLGLSGVISGAIAGGLQSASDAVVGLLNDFGDDVDGWKTDLIDAIKGIVPDSIQDLTFPDITIDLSGIQGPVETAIETVTGWIETIEGLLKRLGVLQAEVASQGWTGDTGMGVAGGGSPGQQQGGGTPAVPSATDPGNQAPFMNEQTRTIGRAVQIPPVIIPAPDTSAYDRVISDLPVRMARSMAEIIPIASAGGQLIGTSLNSGIAPGIQTAIQTFNIFRDTVSVVLSTATSNAATAGTAIGQALYTGVSAGVQSAIQALNIFADYVPAALAGAAGAAHSAGVAIGQGLANGMNSQVGAVQQAAAALAGAATSATMRALAMASPSKVFVGIGHNVGDSFVMGMQSRYGAAGRAGQGLADSSIPTTSAAAYGRRGESVNIGPVFLLRSEEFVRLQEMAERGGAFARDFGPAYRQGAY